MTQHMRRFFLLMGLCLCGLLPAAAQTPKDNAAIAQMIALYKQDMRGPYKDIRWYCADGSYAEPRVGCAVQNKNNLQRARYKDDVEALGRSNHVYLGQILAKTGKTDFWDADYRNSRLKQYQIERFLMNADDGWVNRKGQYYRGATQAEDEEAWGISFFEWILAKDDVIQQNFFLLRQAAKDIPHQGDDSRTQSMRAISRILGDEYAPFMDLRIKIHNQPEATDIAAVRAFQERHRTKLTAGQNAQFAALLKDMEAVFAPIQLSSLDKYLAKMPAESPLRKTIGDFITSQSGASAPVPRARAFAEMMWKIRLDILKEAKPRARLALLDISVQLENIMFREAGAWQPRSLQEELEKIYALGWAAAGGGFLEKWEWEGTEFLIRPPKKAEMPLGELNRYADVSRSHVEWGTGMVRATYNEVITLFGGFEPLAFGFQDDRIRSSVLLHLGSSVGKLGDFCAVQAKFSNMVMDIPEQSRIRGVNPGFARGELVVVAGDEHQVNVTADKIYAFNRPPGDLKPLAGIMTVTEGNIVSHVQLLARNLGIPNAVLSFQNLEALQKYHGQVMFLAVSNKGTVIMKPADKMTETEKKLFEVKKRSEEKITVPVEKINLSQNKVVDLRELRAGDSGKLCGPKAANLGQLKHMFPDHVVDGFVIPFGIFRAHLDQTIPGRTETYWEYVNRIFTTAGQMRNKGTSDLDVEIYTLKELESLRTLIKQMPLMPEFIQDLKDCFQEVLHTEMGKVPVFLRSDTNMEDLKDFTGAGLNLTLFNVVEADKILSGIKDVWASPYSERSYRWRQKYLNDPQNVFPSIVVIPSVNVDYSGVMVTKGIKTDNPEDVTVAFSRGAGGAVDGQAAETFILRSNGGTTLVSPAREPYYNSLPLTGGTQKNKTSFERPILKTTNLKALREMAQQIRAKMATAPGVEAKAGPWDVELGFKDDKIWLFQVRPFVENKNALANEYLRSITPVMPDSKMIPLSTTF
jgi:rifampicin phosphotransferase